MDHKTFITVYREINSLWRVHYGNAMAYPESIRKLLEIRTEFADDLKILADNCLLASGHHLCRSTEEYQKLAMLQ